MSTVRSVIESVNQSKYPMAVEQIRALEELAKAKSETFIRDIHTSLQTAGKEESNKTVPISSTIDSYKEVRAFSANEIYYIGNVVSEALNNFLSSSKPRIVNRVSSLITDAMKIFLDAEEASTDTVEMYYIVTDGLSPVRIDIKAWYCSASEVSVRSYMEKIVAVVAVKSVIDITRVDLGSFLYLFHYQFDAETMTPDELVNSIDEAAHVYNAFIDKADKGRLFGDQPRVHADDTTKVEWAKGVATPKKI